MNRLVAAFLSLAAVYLMSRCGDDPSIQGVTRVDDLEILGTTDATGTITAQADINATGTVSAAAVTASDGTFANGVTVGPLSTDPIVMSGTGDPNGVWSKGIGSLFLQKDTYALWQNTTGSDVWEQVGGGSSTSPSVAITDTTLIVATNLSTLGTIDWWVPFGSLSPAIAPGDTHSKYTGGYILESFRWKNVGATHTAAPGPSFTSTAADDLFGTALSTSSIFGSTLAFGSVPADGLGYRLRVPATTTSRVLRIYDGNSGCSSNTGSRTLTASLRNTGTSASLGPSAGSSSPVPNRVWVITFNSSSANDELVVTVTLRNTGAFIGSCLLMLYGISLGPV